MLPAAVVHTVPSPPLPLRQPHPLPPPLRPPTPSLSPLPPPPLAKHRTLASAPPTIPVRHTNMMPRPSAQERSPRSTLQWSLLQVSRRSRSTPGADQGTDGALRTDAERLCGEAMSALRECGEAPPPGFPLIHRRARPPGGQTVPVATIHGALSNAGSRRIVDVLVFTNEIVRQVKDTGTVSYFARLLCRAGYAQHRRDPAAALAVTAAALCDVFRA